MAWLVREGLESWCDGSFDQVANVALGMEWFEEGQQDDLCQAAAGPEGLVDLVACENHVEGGDLVEGEGLGDAGGLEVLVGHDV